MGNRGLDAGDFLFQKRAALFHLLLPDGIQAPGAVLCCVRGRRVALGVRITPISVSGRGDRLLLLRFGGRLDWRGSVSLRLFPAQVVLVVALVAGDRAAFDLEHARGQPVDEIAIVRDEDHRAAEGRESV